MYAHLDFVVWVKWAKAFERWEAFASEGKAYAEGRELGLPFIVKHVKEITK